MTRSSRLALLTLFAATLLTPFARSQDNYEIQVYGADTVAPRTTMVEIHSNFTVDGSKTVQDGMLPTNHAEHETLELTQGINDWSEVGFYVFYKHSARRGMAVGGRSHPPSRARSREMALAGGREPVAGIRLPACRLFTRHVDLGDPPHRRQKNRPLVFCFQPCARSLASRSKREPGRDVLPRRQVQLRLHQEDCGRTGVLRVIRITGGL